MAILAEEIPVTTWIVLIVLPLGIAGACVTYASFRGCKRKLAKAKTALTCDRLAEALALFKTVAKERIHQASSFNAWESPRGMFEQAMNGIGAAYKKANKVVDLTSILQIRRDFIWMWEDKRFHTFGGAQLTPEGQELEARIKAAASRSFDELPPL